MVIGRRLGGCKKSTSGQAPVLAAIFFLLLVPTTIIIAENVAQNITGDLTTNSSLEIPTENIPPNLWFVPPTPINNSIRNQSWIYINVSSSENLSVCLLDWHNGSWQNLSMTISDLYCYINMTSLTDFQYNFLVYANDTADNWNSTGIHNITINSTPTDIIILDNESIQKPPNETSEEKPEKTETLDPVLKVKLNVPERADRNEPFQISAEVSNTGDQEARDVEVEWILPDSLSILEGSGSHYCSIPTNAACESHLTVAASISSILGEQEIKVLVRYIE